MSLKRSNVLGLSGALEIFRATFVTSEANLAVSFRADTLMRRTLYEHGIRVSYGSHGITWIKEGRGADGGFEDEHRDIWRCYTFEKCVRMCGFHFANVRVMLDKQACQFK